MSLPSTYKHAIFKAKGESLVLEDTPLKQPGHGEILVKVEACGVCHSDMFVQYDIFYQGFPRVPGHEIIGKVAAVGEGVEGWKAGDRIGAGWHGGHDGTCYACQNGWNVSCDSGVINGITKDGGYAEYATINAIAAVRVPEHVDATEFAPILCAGVTVFQALRHSGVKPGETVAVQGLGGLGHLAVQYAKQFGYRVVAVSRGEDKKETAASLGASDFIDASKGDPGAALRELGGAAMVLTTALSSDAITPLIKGLNIQGKLLIVSVPGPLTVNTAELLKYGVSVQVWPTGNNKDSEKAIDFAARHAFSSVVEKFPLAQAQQAYDKMLSGQARYRTVITMD
ncbi:putative alcohol dehydrogenase [Diaporthe ampelina]|uniref:Putative alcohol dehydrogenase n=1 Tax=Diaporthe ampelina TaxID=1214573 RepID=A0A0G2FE04_9PEZI|nr:putative alcohol dehydrogenase [Diaporthe ampelina]